MKNNSLQKEREIGVEISACIGENTGEKMIEEVENNRDLTAKDIF